MARLYDTLAAGLVWEDLADQEHVIAPAGDGLAHQLFRCPIAIHFRGVHQRHAKIKPGPQGSDFLRPGTCGVAHVPRSLAQGRGAASVGKSH